MPDTLALVGPTGILLLVFFCYSISVNSCYRVLIVVSSLYLFDFYVLGDVALMSQEPFKRIVHMSCIYHGRTKIEGSGHENRFKTPARPLPPLAPTPTPPKSNIFTDSSKAMLLLWFTISVIVCLCIYVLVNFFYFGYPLVYFFAGKELSFWFLLVVI